MRRLIPFLAVSAALLAVGCNKDTGDSALDTAAPPPGPDANLNPPSVKKNVPTPPSPGGGAPGAPAPAKTTG